MASDDDVRSELDRRNPSKMAPQRVRRRSDGCSDGGMTNRSGPDQLQTGCVDTNMSSFAADPASGVRGRVAKRDGQTDRGPQTAADDGRLATGEVGGKLESRGAIIAWIMGGADEAMPRPGLQVPDTERASSRRRMSMGAGSRVSRARPQVQVRKGKEEDPNGGRAEDSQQSWIAGRMPEQLKIDGGRTQLGDQATRERMTVGWPVTDSATCVEGR